MNGNSVRNRRKKKYRINTGKLLRFAAVVICFALVAVGGIALIKNAVKGTPQEEPGKTSEPLDAESTAAPKDDAALVHSETKGDSLSNTIIETSERYKVVATYPKTDNDAINRSLASHVRKLVDSFIREVDFDQENRSEMNITYEMAEANTDFLSVCFFMNEKKYPSYAPEGYVKSYVYGKTTGEEIKEAQFFLEGYNEIFNKKLLGYLSTQIDMSEDGFENANFHAAYILRDDSIDLVYAGQDIGIGNRIIRVPVPIEEICAFMADEYRVGSYDVKPTVYARPVKVDSSKKYIAFSFDDGPNGETTQRILSALAEYDARATFFMVGDRIKSDKQRAAVNAVVEAGCEIGNHTFSHTKLTGLSSSELKNAIEQCNDRLEETAGVRAALVRPPGGSVNDKVRENIKYPMINWDVDTRDWESRNKDKVVEHIKNDIKDGSIVLMHDLYSTTADAVEEILPWLYENGYVVVTVSELMEIKGVALSDGNVYYSAR